MSFYGFGMFCATYYAFQFDPERIARLVSLLRPVWQRVETELTVFTSFLEQVGK